MSRTCPLAAALLFPCLALLLPAAPAHALMFGPEQIVTAGGAAIAVPGYSVPSMADWNSDGLADLIVGQGSGYDDAKVRVYLNGGTAAAPAFSSYSYVQSAGVDLTLTGSGCMGLFPRVVYWDDDARKDLLVGDALGTFHLYLNTGTDEDPRFDGGTLLQVGQAGSKTVIDVGSRATPDVVDWNNDGRKDLVSGGYDGRIHIFVNEGTDTEPDFRVETFAQDNGVELSVPSLRSSPVAVDLDDDGRKDILAGNTNGQLLFYANTGTDAAPAFSGYSAVGSNGTAIDLAGTPRSRPFVCDWTGDGLLDVLVGSGDGLVRLYEAPIPGDTNNDRRVDAADAATVADHWGQTLPGGYTVGDFNGDGQIGVDDAAILAAQWGHGTSEVTPVPEPSTVALALVAATVLLITRRSGFSG